MSIMKSRCFSLLFLRNPSPLLLRCCSVLCVLVLLQSPRGGVEGAAAAIIREAQENTTTTTPQEADEILWKCDDMTPDFCDDLVVETGYVKIPLDDDDYDDTDVQVKYWSYSSSDTTTTTTTTDPPLIVANGGPGYPHNYTLPLRQIACRSRRPVIFYDQAGCGESTVVSKKKNRTQHSDDDGVVYPFLLNTSYYATVELPTVLNALNVGPFHLMGHSWGTMLALEYAINATDPSRDNLQSLILASPIPDIQDYINLQWDPRYGLMERMNPPYLLERLKKLIDRQDFEAPEYQALSDVMTGRFAFRNMFPPDCMLETLTGINEDIYVGMQGVGEFSEATGTLRLFDGYTRLPEINVPVLLVAGEFDMVRPYTLEKIQQKLDKYAVPSKVAYIETSGHLLMLDNAGPLNDLTSDFIKRVETGADIGSSNIDSTATVEKEETSLEHFFFPHILVSLLVGAVIGYFVGKRRPSNYEAL